MAGYAFTIVMSYTSAWMRAWLARNERILWTYWPNLAICNLRALVNKVKRIAVHVTHILIIYVHTLYTNSMGSWILQLRSTRLHVVGELDGLVEGAWALGPRSTGRGGIQPYIFSHERSCWHNLYSRRSCKGLTSSERRVLWKSSENTSGRM